jgi:hypothetical protein
MEQRGIKFWAKLCDAVADNKIFDRGSSWTLRCAISRQEFIEEEILSSGCIEVKLVLKLNFLDLSGFSFLFLPSRLPLPHSSFSTTLWAVGKLVGQ